MLCGEFKYIVHKQISCQATNAIRADHLFVCGEYVSEDRRLDVRDLRFLQGGRWLL